MRYSRYKPTGIPWLPEIPEGWGGVRAKYAFKKEQRPVREGDEIVTCFRDGEVTLRRNRRLTGFTEATDYSHYQHICRGDLVIHQMDAFAGSCGVSDSDGMGTPVLSVCTPLSQEYLSSYFAKVVRLMGLNGYIHSLYRGIRERSSDFRFETFAKQWLPLPPLSTQRAIVAFLDEKCGKVNRLVAAKEEEVALLKELKQSMIAEAVTRGVRANRRLVPSGIPWLPEIPEGWEVLRLKWILNEIKNLSTTGEELPLSLTASNGLIPFSEKANRTMESASYVGAKIVEQGQIVFNRFKARLFAVAPCRGLVSPDYAVYSTKTDVEKQYLLALFATPQFRQAMNNQASGIGDGFSRLYSSELFKLNIPIPPLAEQREIVAHIEARAAKIDAAVAGLEKEIAALKEYKQRLIADVVTGQRRVA